jgi:hypothetical protein
VAVAVVEILMLQVEDLVNQVVQVEVLVKQKIQEIHHQ